jgi:NAD(P)H dehydrogenase (quinone)
MILITGATGNFGHENKTYNLTNNTSVGFEQIVTYISEALGKEVNYNTTDVESFKATFKKSGVPDMYMGMFIMWGTAVAEGMMDKEDNVPESLHLRSLQPALLR